MKVSREREKETVRKVSRERENESIEREDRNLVLVK